MAVANSKPASKRLIEAAAIERQALEHDLRALDERRLALQSELRSVEIAEREMRRRLQLVSEIAGGHRPRALRAVEAPDAEPRSLLRGRAIRGAAVRVVATSSEPTRPRHYSDWYAELVSAGYAVAGRDPQAAFLTQLNRSPVVRREPEPGVYRLDFEAVRELELQLVELNCDLSRLHHGQQTIEAITSVHEERERITREIDRLVRIVAEATADLSLNA